ncbi:MAG: hypothetical protein OXG35_33460 [Acidobacteria bacterium]|nr:hypothetical protein [Acidobacteriota bacterium]
MKTPTELNVTRTPRAGCAKIWKKHHEMIEDLYKGAATSRRPTPYVCMLRDTGPRPWTR